MLSKYSPSNPSPLAETESLSSIVIVAVRGASKMVGEVMGKGAIVVYESTVYPGVTEDRCAPLICEVSGLSRDQFKLDYYA